MVTYCGLAQSLGVVGDRWNLLIVRQLLIAPARYRDLIDGVPGIATNLLADRLRDLEARARSSGDWLARAAWSSTPLRPGVPSCPNRSRA